MNLERARTIAEQFARGPEPSDHLRAIEAALDEVDDDAAFAETLVARGIIDAGWLRELHVGSRCAWCDGVGALGSPDQGSNDIVYSHDCTLCDATGTRDEGAPRDRVTIAALAARKTEVTTATALAREAYARWCRWMPSAAASTKTPLIAWRTVAPREKKLSWIEERPMGWSRPHTIAEAIGANERAIRAEPNPGNAPDAMLTGNNKRGGPSLDLRWAAQQTVVTVRARFVEERGDQSERAKTVAEALEHLARDASDAANLAQLREAEVEPWCAKPDAFEPLMAIWALGVGVIAVRAHAVLLFAPPLR
ncbi:MAG: hypothetical protein JNK05_36700 [Myxococcales bacterium]|nr:hypothetical protein [Myxococcales bacterium]